MAVSRNAEALARSLEEHATIEGKLNQLRDVAQVVVTKVFGSVLSTSTPAILLTGIPDMVQTLISDSVFHAVSGVLTLVATHYPTLDFDAVCRGYADGWSTEGIQTLGQNLALCVRVVAANVTA